MLLPHPHPQLFREHLGCPAEGLARDGCVSPGEAARKSSGRIPGTGMRSASDGFQEGLLLFRAWRCLSWEHHRPFPKGNIWMGT